MTLTIKIKKNGKPEVLELINVEIKDPQQNEVLIDQLAIGLNYIDIYHRTGMYPLPLPSGIGLEGVGKIKKIGTKVKDFSVGDMVAYAGAPIGAYAKERIYEADKLVKAPDICVFRALAFNVVVILVPFKSRLSI